MQLFSSQSIQQIPANDSHVFAFHITGNVTDDDSEALAKFMNAAFDNADTVNMLMLFEDFEGSEWDSMFDDDVIKSQFRALIKVEKYAVVGAPERASKLISAMDWILPVDAKAFERRDLDKAWTFVGSQPVTPREASVA